MEFDPVTHDLLKRADAACHEAWCLRRRSEEILSLIGEVRSVDPLDPRRPVATRGARLIGTGVRQRTVGRLARMQSEN